MINDESAIVVPVDPRYLGSWLTGLFGDPDTTDNLDGSWDHVFASGGDGLPGYTIEVGMPKVPAFFVHAGVVALDPAVIGHPAGQTRRVTHVARGVAVRLAAAPLQLRSVLGSHSAPQPSDEAVR